VPWNQAHRKHTEVVLKKIVTSIALVSLFVVVMYSDTVQAQQIPNVPTWSARQLLYVDVDGHAVATNLLEMTFHFPSDVYYVVLVSPTLLPTNSISGPKIPWRRITAGDYVKRILGQNSLTYWIKPQLNGQMFFQAVRQDSLPPGFMFGDD
jgi:hypothetical protein